MSGRDLIQVTSDGCVVVAGVVRGQVARTAAGWVYAWTGRAFSRAFTTRGQAGRAAAAEAMRRWARHLSVTP